MISPRAGLSRKSIRSQLVQGGCRSTSDHSQFWQNFWDGSEGGHHTYEFKNGHSGKCMEIQGKQSSGNALQGTCTSSGTEIWYTHGA